MFDMCDTDYLKHERVIYTYIKFLKHILQPQNKRYLIRKTCFDFENQAQNSEFDFNSAVNYVILIIREILFRPLQLSCLETAYRSFTKEKS